MPDETNRIREQVMKVYGDQIAAYARGSVEMEKSAINVVSPAIAALTMAEEYAAIVLTSRMDNELRKMLNCVLHRQGDAEVLLFDFNMPFGSFSAKVAAAYSFGFLTKKMYEAITSCRKIRNAYAHADDPDDARKSKDYLKHAPRLKALDPEHARESIKKFKALRARCAGLIEVTPECSEVSAMMLSVCENLGSATFFSLGAASTKLRVIPAFYGADDAIASMATLVPEGEPRSGETAPEADAPDHSRQQN
jgi:hypothetical protein